MTRQNDKVSIYLLVGMNYYMKLFCLCEIKFTFFLFAIVKMTNKLDLKIISSRKH